MANPESQPPSVEILYFPKNFEDEHLFEGSKEVFIKPLDQTMAVFSKSFTSDSSLKIAFQDVQVCNDSSDPNIVMLNGDRYKIMSTNRELLPLENVSNDPKLFSKPSCPLTHRFSLALLLLVSICFSDVS